MGAINRWRAEQLVEQIVVRVHTNRARLVLLDISGAPAISSDVADLVVFTAEVTQLLGARMIVSGLSAQISQKLVETGVHLGKITAVGDLHGGIEEAERLLGYKVVPLGNSPSSGDPPPLQCEA
jgi:rsbT co-antagonist protein RsbR